MTDIIINMFDPSFDWLRVRKTGILSERAGGPILQADWTTHKTKLKGLGCSKEYCSATYWRKTYITEVYHWRSEAHQTELHI